MRKTRSDREIAFVDPHLDMQTKTVMITVSKRFGDSGNVLAMDVNISPIQEMVNELLSSDGGMFLELDIDNFKAINDTYGHQTGDLVILAVADAIRSAFRTNDVTMRLGGDEFGAFAAGIVSREMGEAIVQRLFRRLEALDLPELRGERISVSAGAVLDPDGKASFHALYALADDAMYLSKKNSGNSLTFSAG